MKETKRRLEFFSLYDHTNIEKHLEKMAAKGWMIEEIGTYFWKYKKIEPQKLRFSVVYYPKKVNEGTIISADRQHFIDMCTSGGWNYVLNKEEMHIFYCEDENTPPIETDAEIQIECIHKFAKREIIFNYSILIVACLPLLSFFISLALKQPVDTITDELYRVWFTPFFIVFSIYNIISYLIWHKKAESAAENGEFTDTKRLIRFEVMFWISPICFSAALELFTLLRTRYVFFILGLIIFAVMLFYLFKKIRNSVYKLKYEDETKHILKSFIGVFLVIAYVAAGIGAFKILPKPYDKIEVETAEGIKAYEVYHDEGAPLDITEFSDVENKTVSREKTVDEAIFVKQEKWSIYTVEDGDNASLSYTITDVRFAPLYERSKNELIFNHIVYDYKEIEINSDNGETYRYYIEEDEDLTQFAFCGNNRIVEIHFGWEPTDEQIAIAAENLMKSEYQEKGLSHEAKTKRN